MRMMVSTVYPSDDNDLSQRGMSISLGGAMPDLSPKGGIWTAVNCGMCGTRDKRHRQQMT